MAEAGAALRLAFMASMTSLFLWGRCTGLVETYALDKTTEELLGMGRVREGWRTLRGSDEPERAWLAIDGFKKIVALVPVCSSLPTLMF